MRTCEGSWNCSDGLILPLLPEEEAQWSPHLRGFLYFLGLLYSFLGVAIAADVFMCSIERITSQKRKVKISAADAEAGKGEDEGSDVVLYKEVEIWNPTVANLTLMALGSSAPEILLSIIEIMGKGFKAGELGPGTIVGSAAFNLLAISSICVVSIPKDETRRIQEIWVFGVTSAFSIFAYIWLLIILKGPSKGKVEVWEGVLTLSFFGVVVIAAYIADKKPWTRWGKTGGKREPDAAEKSALSDAAENFQLQYGGPGDAQLSAEMARWREVEREMALQYPELPVEELAKAVAYRLKMEEPHNRLYYRIMASRWMGRSRKSQEYWDAASKRRKLAASASISHLPGAPSKKLIEFSTRVFAVVPGERTVRLQVIRRGRNAKKLLFHYETVNGLAKKNTHFLPRAETLVFEPGETEKVVTIELVENVEWKVGDTFYVRLGTEDEKTELGACSPAEITYFDPNDKSTVEFVKNHKHVRESAGHVRIPLVRRGGVGGRSTVGWETEDITAETGKDYEGGRGEVEFLPGEVEKYLDIGIIDDMYEEYAETFRVTLSNASPPAHVGLKKTCVVTITCDDGAAKYFRQMDTLVPNLLGYLSPGGRTWKEQILAAITVNAGDTENATVTDMLFHILAFPWKVIFSLVPPPSMLGGWLTFIVALGLIGLLTAIVGDLAGIFGCLVGLKPSVTAITFVALGTSLPDTFASRLAAVQEATADNSIGNVTGSNCVNVFLGLGLPWLIASIYWSTKNKPFEVPAGTLAFSVTIYTVCAVLAIALLMARRYLPYFGKAELGGPTVPKYLSGAFLVFLWFLYVLLSSLQAYDHIPGF